MIHIVTLYLFFSINALASPKIAYLNTDLIELHSEQDIVTFSLIATDDSGIENLAGAVLTDSLTEASYGIFVAGTQKGAYTFSLSLSQMMLVRPHEPGPEGIEARKFLIQVFNNSEEVVSKEIELTLHHGFIYSELAFPFFSELPQQLLPLAKVTRYNGQKEFLFPTFSLRCLAADYCDVNGQNRIYPNIYDDVLSLVNKYNLQDFIIDTIAFNFKSEIRCIERNSTPQCWRRVE